MSDTKLSVTNRDIWNAMSTDGSTPSALAEILAAPCSVTGAYNGSVLWRAAEAAFKDIRAGHIALVKEFGTEGEGGNYTVTNLEAFIPEWEKFLDTPITLDARALKISELRPNAFVAPANIVRCGALVVE